MEQFLSNFARYHQTHSLVHSGENTRRFDDVISADCAPLDIGGITVLVDGDGMTIDDELVILGLDASLETSVD